MTTNKQVHAEIRRLLTEDRQAFYESVVDFMDYSFDTHFSSLDDFISGLRIGLIDKVMDRMEDREPVN